MPHFEGNHGYVNPTITSSPPIMKIISLGNCFDRSAFTHTLATSKFLQAIVSGCSLSGTPAALDMKHNPSQEYILIGTFVRCTHNGVSFPFASSSTGDHLETTIGIPAMFHMPRLTIFSLIASLGILILIVTESISYTSIFCDVSPSYSESYVPSQRVELFPRIALSQSLSRAD